MVEKIKKLLFPKIYADLMQQGRHQNDWTLKLYEREATVAAKEKDIEDETNRRVAATLMKMDPFEPLLQKYHGTFGKDYTRPEEKLNAQGQIQMFMWGHMQQNDPSFKHLMQWILDSEGNKMVRHSNPTPDTILFSRAMIAARGAFSPPNFTIRSALARRRSSQATMSRVHAARHRSTCASVRCSTKG